MIANQKRRNGLDSHDGCRDVPLPLGAEIELLQYPRLCPSRHNQLQELLLRFPCEFYIDPRYENSRPPTGSASGQGSAVRLQCVPLRDATGARVAACGVRLYDTIDQGQVQWPIVDSSSWRVSEIHLSGQSKRFFRWPEKLAGREDRQRISAIAVRVESKPPAFLVAKVAQPAQVRWCVPQPFQVLLATLWPVRRRPIWPKWLWLLVSIHVAELSTKTDVESRVATGEMLLCVTTDPLLCVPLHSIGNLCTAAAGIKYPPLLRHFDCTACLASAHRPLAPVRRIGSVPASLSWTGSPGGSAVRLGRLYPQ
jgi:hypothetical protein